MLTQRSLLAALAVGVMGSAIAAQPAQAQHISAYNFDPNLNQFSFTTNTDVVPKAQLLANPTRMVIDLPGITVKNTRTEAQTNRGALRQIRLGQFEPGTARIVLEFAPSYQPNVSDLNLRGLTYRQWVLEMPSPAR